MREYNEREIRVVFHMPAEHPEHLLRELPDDQEEYLAGLAAELWPHDEWAFIADEVRRAEGQS